MKLLSNRWQGRVAPGIGLAPFGADAKAQPREAVPGMNNESLPFPEGIRQYRSTLNV